MADSINNKAKEYYDNDNSGGSLNNNLKDFLKQQGAEGNSLNTLWRNYAYGEGGNSLNTRLGKLWGTSGSLIKRWKDVLGLTWDDLKLFFNARRNDPELLLSGATSFDGSGDYINCGNDSSLDITDAITVSAWMLTTVTNDHQRIVAKQFETDNGTVNSCFQLCIHQNNKFRWAVGGVFDISSSDSIVPNTWNHMVGTYDKTTAKLYVNGQLVQSTSATAVIRTSSQDLTIGTTKFNSSIEHETHGSIANVGIWNRALSASEIESIYWKGQFSDLKGTELTNLVSWYNLSADANDSTGTNNGTNNGATFLTDAYSASSPFLPRIQDKASDTIANYGEVYGGNAVSFDGVSDKVQISNFPTIGQTSSSSGYSISCYFKADSVSAWVSLFSFGDQATSEKRSLMISSGGKLSVSHYNDNVSGSTTLSTGVWYHGVCTIASNGSAIVYLNGSSDGTGSVTLTSYSGTTAYIGSNPNGNGEFFNGMMSGVKVFNTVLTQDQVRELYTKPELTLPTGVSSSALKLDMPMQEGSGTAILDGSGNQNHGTGNGITWATGQEYGFQHPLVRSNNPMVFDGGDDHVDVVGFGNIFGDNYAGSLTTSMWVKIDDTSQNQGVLNFTTHSNTSSVFSVFVSANQLFYYLNVSGYRISNSFTSNDWNHIVAVYDTAGASGTKLYLNGSEIGTHAGTFPSDSDMDFAGLKLVIGSYYNPSLALHGIMNEVAVWDSALTASEITALYNSGLPLLPITDSGNYASSSD